MRQNEHHDSAADFVHARHGRLKFLRESFGFSTLRDTLKKEHHGWLGHVARLEETTPIRKLIAWRWAANLQQIDSSSASLMPRRSRTGPPRTYDICPTHLVDVDWMQVAMSRPLWATLKSNALQAWGDHWPFRPTRLFSNRIECTSEGKRCPFDIGLIFFSRASVVVKAANGNCKTERLDPVVMRMVEIVDWNLHVLDLCRLKPALYGTFMHDKPSQHSVIKDHGMNIDSQPWLDESAVIQRGDLIIVSAHACRCEHGAFVGLCTVSRKRGNQSQPISRRSLGINTDSYELAEAECLHATFLFFGRLPISWQSWSSDCF